VEDSVEIKAPTYLVADMGNGACENFVGLCGGDKQLVPFGSELFEDLRSGVEHFFDNAVLVYPANVQKICFAEHRLVGNMAEFDWRWAAGINRNFCSPRKVQNGEVAEAAKSFVQIYSPQNFERAIKVRELPWGKYPKPAIDRIHASMDVQGYFRSTFYRNGIISLPKEFPIKGFFCSEEVTI
jgi:hypothetical protein